MHGGFTCVTWRPHLRFLDCMVSTHKVTPLNSSSSVTKIRRVMTACDGSVHRVWQTITFGSFDIESSFLICRYIFMRYGSFHYEGHRIKVKVTATSRRRKIPHSHKKNFNHNDSGSVEDRTVKFACSMECSARADRIVWPSHSSCDRNTIIRGWLDLPYTLEGNLALAFFFRIIMFNFLLINIITTTTIIIMITIINYCTCLTSTGNCINGRFMLHDLSSLSAASHTGRTRQ